MIRYLVKLLILCAIGAAAAWFGLPLLKTHAPGPYAKVASLLLGRPVAVGTTGEVADAGKAGELLGGALAKAGDTAGDAAGKIGLPAGQPVTELFKNFRSREAGEEAAAPELPEGASATTNENGSIVVYVEEELPPDPRGALNDDPGYPMAIVITNSFYFDARGNKLGSMPGGTVVETLETAQAVDKMVCKTVVFHPVKRLWQDREVWFEATDLLVLNAPYQDLPRAERDALVDYCTAKGKWMDEYGRLAEKAAAKYAADHKNPYEAEYQAAKAKHDELMKRISENKKKLDYSKFHDDPQRPAYLREGQKLAGEQREDAKTWLPILQKWQAWESAHMTPTDTFSPPGDGDDAAGGSVKVSARPSVFIPEKGESVSVEETSAMKEAREKMEALGATVRAIAPNL